MPFVYIHFLLPPLALFYLLSFYPLVLWLPPPPPMLLLLTMPPPLFLPPSRLFPSLMPSSSTILMRVASACNIFCSSRSLTVRIYVNARYRSLCFCWMSAMTAVVITYFTSFLHSIAAFALLKTLLTDFVLPVSRHNLSILSFSSQKI